MRFFLFGILVLLLLSCAGVEQEVVVTAVPVETPASVPTGTDVALVVPSNTVAAPATGTAVPTNVPEAAVEPAETATVSPTLAPEVLTFAVIGDYGTTGTGSQEVAALVNGWDPDLLLTVGDNNYPDGAAETMERNVGQFYGRFIEEGRFFPVLGNHDVTTDFGRPYLDYFELPGNERYYDFVQGDVHFFAVNSDWREPDGIVVGSRQAEWLREQMAGSSTRWQVVYFHAAPYVSMEAKEVDWMRWPFAEWGADLVLSGHAHLYERLTIDGIPFVVNGLGGGGIYDFDEEPIEGSEVRFNKDYGALLVEVTEKSLAGEFVTRAGVEVDWFEINQ